MFVLLDVCEALSWKAALRIGTGCSHVSSHLEGKRYENFTKLECLMALRQGDWKQACLTHSVCVNILCLYGFADRWLNMCSVMPHAQGKPQAPLRYHGGLREGLPPRALEIAVLLCVLNAVEPSFAEAGY